MARLFIHAPNIHRGGGKALLAALLNCVPANLELYLVIDDRLELPGGLPEQVKRVAASVSARISAEKWLANEVEADDTVLCFGNLPPLFKLRGRVVLFIQNRYLIEPGGLAGFPLKTRLKLGVERVWLTCCIKNADEVIVQSPTMKRLLEARAARLSINVLPFMLKIEDYNRSCLQTRNLESREFDFVYVASGEPHKNHRHLVAAWCLLAAENFYPSLLLTLDEVECADLYQWIRHKIGQQQLKIVNLGNLQHDQVGPLYDRARALIYPSTLESFGMPLVEARQAGIAVVASELDYVRDILDPDETFDPGSVVSIARAIKRYMNFAEQSLPLQDAAGFMQYVLRDRS